MSVWDEYLREQRNDTKRVQEHRERIVMYRDKTMKYCTVTKGEEPDGGYPLYIALHGGGGESAEYNDGAWQRMQGNIYGALGKGFT